MNELVNQLFLTEEQADELTGIRRGERGKTKHMLQCAFLRNTGIAHIVNARGRPIIPMVAINGGRPDAPRKAWQPRVV